jgi:starch synthase (maltosyl-transferring)
VRIGRIPITRVWPAVDGGKFAAKAFVGEVVRFGANAFREGHDRIAVELILESPSGKNARVRMLPGRLGHDEWLTDLAVNEPGDWTFWVSAWSDDYATWLYNTEVKLHAGVDEELMLLEGVQLLTKMAAATTVKSVPTDFAPLLEILKDSAHTPKLRLEAALAAGMSELAHDYPLRSLETLSARYQLRCERQLAGSGAWYEFFPRSEGAKRAKDGSWIAGTFKTAAKRLPAVAAMGFDVLYLPPIHPIGETNRKGKNNSLQVEPGDPGSPWAIGAATGGHDTIHPDLGTEADFKSFLRAAKKSKLEVALDLALQASPDHPWVKTNPEWFTTRADGSIAYAENPPKKYQDIYPINFDNDFEGIYAEVLRVVTKWIDLGVKIFRVDNPHTKPVHFWQQLIAEVNAKHPDVVFLAEAFTRPAMMHTLAKAGFQQSYTYFAWRNTKAELESYLAELAHESADFFRPNLWVNTPDILTEYLQFGGKPAFKIRATVAAMAAPLWGMYAGFELYEAVARPGSEENIDNEKYEYKTRDWELAERSGQSLAPRISKLNQIRRENPALGQLRNLRIHQSDDDSMLVFSKHLDGAFTQDGVANTIIVVINLDPHSVRETLVHLSLDALDVGGSFTVRDLLSDKTYEWSQSNYVRLDAFAEPAHIFRIERS